MARTQAADYEQKRELITTNAAEQFARRGFSGASIADIAAACSFSKSLIYHYYGSKEELLFDVMSEHIDDLLSVTQIERDGISPPDYFKELSRLLLRCYTGAADKQKVLLYELDFLPKANRDEIVTKQRTLVKRFEDALVACNPDIVKDKARLRATVMLFFGMLNWTHTWFKSGRGISRDQLADMAAENTLGVI